MKKLTRNDNEVRAFFDRWHVYYLVIQNDYMAHRGIHQALRDSLSSSRQSPFSIMDLGCGDCSVIAKTLRGLPVREYVGIDLSEVALEEAKKSFADSTFRLRLVESDFSKFVARPETDKVDVVIAGFAVHHLTHDEKPKFFSDCFDKLSSGGDLYLYDIFSRPGESRAQFLESYCKKLESNWIKLSVEERAATCDHIRNCDFPVSYEVLSGFARQAGFHTPPEPDYVDDDGFHCLCHFKRQDQ